MIIDDNFEKLVLACLVKLPQFLAVASNHLKTDLFDSVIDANIAKITIQHYKKYRVSINNMVFVHYLKELVNKKIVKAEELKLYADRYKILQQTNVENWKWVLDNLILFIRKQEIRRFIENCVDNYLEKEDFQKIEKDMQRILNIKNFEVQEAYEYWSKIEDRSVKRIEEEEIKMYGISTGITSLDNALYKKGWWKQELYLILGAPKKGKSFSLLYFANIASLQGFNVVYYTLEVSKDIMADRLDAMNTDIETTMLKTKIKDVENKIKQLSDRAGRIFFFDYKAGTTNANVVRGDLKKLIEKGEQIHMLVIDYADLMQPTRFTGDVWKDEGNVFIELRDIAKEFNIPVLTASQINRDGAKKQIATGTDGAGTFDKIKHADFVCTLNQTEEEKQKDELRIHISENRNGMSKTIKIQTEYQKGKFCKKVLSEVI